MKILLDENIENTYYAVKKNGDSYEIKQRYPKLELIIGR